MRLDPAKLHPFFAKPIGRAVWATVGMALFGVAARYVWGAFDPDMRRWTFVTIAPIIGGVVYLQESGRAAVLAGAMIGLGVVGVLFWSAVLILGGMPITSSADYAYITFIVAVPVGCILLGLYGWRKARVKVGDTHAHE